MCNFIVITESGFIKQSKINSMRLLNLPFTLFIYSNDKYIISNIVIKIHV